MQFQPSMPGVQLLQESFYVGNGAHVIVSASYEGPRSDLRLFRVVGGDTHQEDVTEAVFRTQQRVVVNLMNLSKAYDYVTGLQDAYLERV